MENTERIERLERVVVEVLTHMELMREGGRPGTVIRDLLAEMGVAEEVADEVPAED